MKLVYMGTPDFAVEPLEALIEEGKHEIALVVTQPDKAKGRSKELQFPPVKECALLHGICVEQPERVRGNEAFYEKLEEINPDLIVVVAFGQILPESVLNLPKYGCINVHASLLPKYRGAAPIQWAVINGDQTTGVTIQQMDKGVDTGDVIAVKEIALDEKETGGSLFDRLAKLSRPLLLETIDKILDGTIEPVKQEDALATHAKMLNKQTGHVLPSMTAEAVERLIRGCNPWPGTYCMVANKMMKLWDSKVADANALPKNPAGSIVASEDHKRLYLYLAEDSVLELLEVQLEGKKRMDVEAFLRGYSFEENCRIG